MVEGAAWHNKNANTSVWKQTKAHSVALYVTFSGPSLSTALGSRAEVVSETFPNQELFFSFSMAPSGFHLKPNHTLSRLEGRLFEFSSLKIQTDCIQM